MSDFLRSEAMKFLQSCRGRDKAMPRTELFHHLRLFEPRLSDRRLRDIYSELPVCSSEDGLFIPKTTREVMDFRAYVTKAHGPIIAARRCEVIFSFYPKLRPIAEAQGELF